MNDIHTHPEIHREEARVLRATVRAKIPRPPGEVYEYLANLENNRHWNWSVTATTPLTSGSAQTGSRYLQASAAEPEQPQMLEITATQPPELLEVKAAGGATTATYRYELHPGADDTAEMTVYAEVRPGHPVGRPDLYVQRLQNSLQANVDTLRHLFAQSHQNPGQGATPPGGKQGR